jgi:hypothetical protein
MPTLPCAGHPDSPLPLQPLRPGERRQALRLGAGWALAGLAAAVSGPALGAALQETPAPQLAAAPAELQETLPGARALGVARMRFLGLDIYQARLWVDSSFKPQAWAESAFALELNYARALSGRLIAERSLKEMRRQASPDAAREAVWLAAMVQAFPDVKAGDRVTGLHTPGQGARFWFNGQPRPGVRDAEFSRLFFGIWLSDASSEPQLRDSLLGRSS